MLLRELLFPKACLSCGFLGAYVCPSCHGKLKRIINDSCLYCGRASLAGLTHPACFKKNGIDSLTSIFYYDNRLKKIIKEIKYRRVQDAMKELIMLINYRTVKKLKNTLSKETQVQPIPLHFRREKERGFNQATTIAGSLGELLSIPTINVLIRKKATVAQAQLSEKEERKKNIRGAFFVEDKKIIERKDILLVDDVITTGATVKEAARELKKSGAKKIYVFALAKG